MRKNTDRLALKQQRMTGGGDDHDGGPSISRMRLPLAVLGVALALSVDAASAFTELRASGTRSTRFYGEGTRKQQPSTATLLQYTRDGDNHQGQQQQQNRVDVQIVDSNNGRWWNPLQLAAKRTAERDEQQAVVDDYLEFLDKRYHRLHDEEVDSLPSRRTVSGAGEAKKFSALNWLMQGEQQQQSSVARNPKDRQEDALYVLGVAGLASQRLLQQKKLPRAVGGTTDLSPFEGKMEKPKPIAVDAEVEVSAAAVVSAEESKKDDIVSRRLAPVLRQVSARRRKFLQYQSRQAASLAVAVVRAAAKLPVRAGRAAWNMGGGRRNVAFTLTFAATLCFFVARPIAQSVVSEGRM